MQHSDADGDMNQVYCSQTEGNDGEVRGFQTGGSGVGAVGGGWWCL